MKRIKNFFDNYTGTPQDAPFILNGENKMKTFVDSILSGARQSLSTSNQIRNNTGMMDNQELKMDNSNDTNDANDADDEWVDVKKIL